jgi:hypothetical protein
MDNLLHIAQGVNVIPTLLEIKNNPQLWNQHAYRTSSDDSPHREVSDIWVRYNDINNLDMNDPQKFNQEHESVWYPSIDKLPSIKKIAYDLMHYVNGERLGGILITKIKPGKQCYPHDDVGSWHSAYYDKYAVQLEGDCKQAFHFEEGSFSAKPGDIYWFNNQEKHWVTNDSDVDRITMIICIRTNKGA